MSLLLSRKTVRNRIKGLGRTHLKPCIEVLEGRALLSNLLVNGDFELGNTGFTTQYPNTNTTGGYIIGHNPAVDRGGAFSSFGDHTTGTGLMDLVDGATSPNEEHIHDRYE